MYIVCVIIYVCITFSKFFRSHMILFFMIEEIFRRSIMLCICIHFRINIMKLKILELRSESDTVRIKVRLIRISFCIDLHNKFHNMPAS